MKLSNQTIGAIPDGVARPSYDRSAQQVGIVHIGVGGFHRAHMAMYLDRLMNEGKALDWAICGVGLLPGDARMRDALHAQDCLYTLVLKDPGGQREARVIGSIAEYLFAPDDPDAVIERMTDPAVRIVSMTLTEGGYNVHRVSGEFDLSRPDVARDLSDPSRPTTAFGLVTEALRRRERGIEPFTVLSCDNVRDNGAVARRAFSAYAAARDADLGAWIGESVAFPSSMVDRITPVTADADRAELRDRFGIDDAWPVVAERFEQWVLEDHFPTGRPPWQEAAAQLVSDVEPYELMKLRLLNSTHQGMCYFGYLAGHRYAHEAAADPLIADFLLDYMRNEATPTLRPVPGVDLDRYQRTLIERYRNPDVRDTLARLCADSSNRIPTWLVPTIRERVGSGQPVPCSAAIVASWARYAEGVDERGAAIDVVDEHADRLVPLARSQRENPTAFLAQPEFFGDLAEHPGFAAEYTKVLRSLHEVGARATLELLAQERRARQA